MSYLNFYKSKNEDKESAFQEISSRIKLADYAIEKDWWVVQTLRVIFQMDAGQHLLFKGGTSLSKAWGVIDRFSEDIDLALNREFLGFDSGLISKTQVRKLRSASFKYITETFNSDLQTAFKASGIDELTFEYENLGDGDQDPVSILIYYPNVVDYPEYIQPKIKVEIGSRSMKDPYTNRSFRSMVGDIFSDKYYADTEISVPCINPERTYLEKLFLLHEEFQKPKEKIRVNRLSRHLYDIYRISQSEHKVKAQSAELIEAIIKHRARFSNMKGVDYDSHYPPTLNSMPPDEYIKAWEKDYEKMRTEMIPVESPSFEELIKVIRHEIAAYNELEINFDEK